MQVIATAGHVDHGKSTLVRALTGMEPDRWAEEVRRGMTIDLGFAWTRLPSGRLVAFVDVPGHERFATNMLAGVGPAPAALLVVAADEGWAGQTEDHVRALHALNVSQGILAVSRSDLADPSTTLAEAADRLASTSLAGIPAVAVSATTGEGLDRLRQVLDDLTAAMATPDPHTQVRLWLDRCFVVRGSGTVVTGTLPAGTIHHGDVLELNGHPVTVRGVQCLGEPVVEVSGVARVALNLRGISHEDIRRGDSLLSPKMWRATSSIDVRASTAQLPSHLVVHIGSAAVPARVRVFPGGRGDDPLYARLVLDSPLPLIVGDQLLLRDPGRRAILGGARVIDPAPPALDRRGSARKRAEALQGESGEPNLGRELIRRGTVSAVMLARIGVSIPDPLPDTVVRVGGWLVDRTRWTRWLDDLRAAADAPRSGALLEAGVPRADLIRALRLPAPEILTDLVSSSRDLEEVGGCVRPRGRTANLRPDIAAAVGELNAVFAEKPFSAPEQSMLAALGLGRQELGAAAAAGAILRLPGEIILPPDAPERAVEVLCEVEQPFTLSTARKALDTTRRVAVPLLEYLDGKRVTERVDGDRRRLRHHG
jgi:selenocysteine-specific elongation factor